MKRQKFTQSIATTFSFLLLLFVIPTLACSLTQAQISSKLSAQKTATKTELPTGVLPSTSTASPTPPRSCQVTAESLHLRAQPGINAPAIGYLHSGDPVKPLPTPAAGTWLAVETFNGQTGYINSKFTNCERK